VVAAVTSYGLNGTEFPAFFSPDAASSLMIFNVACRRTRAAEVKPVGSGCAGARTRRR
jgi:hypothetical protein